MNGVLLVNKSGGLLFAQKYAEHFGLPEPTDEMNLAALLFALQTYGESVLEHDDEADFPGHGTGIGNQAPLSMHQMDNVVLHFYSDADRARDVLSVVIVDKDLDPKFGRKLAREIAHQFVDTFGDAVVNAVSHLQFTRFKDVLSEYLQSVPRVLASHICQCLQPPIPWLLTVPLASLAYPIQTPQVPDVRPRLRCFEAGKSRFRSWRRQTTKQCSQRTPKQGDTVPARSFVRVVVCPQSKAGDSSGWPSVDEASYSEFPLGVHGTEPCVLAENNSLPKYLQPGGQLDNLLRIVQQTGRYVFALL